MAEPRPSPLRLDAAWRVLFRWARAGRITILTTFVVFQLFFMVFRGFLDLNYQKITGWLHERKGWPILKPVFEPADRFTERYGAFFGIEQGWRLYTGPIARSATFLAARIEFSDGSDAVVYSENEPDPKRFFRIGGWRQRKLEDTLVENVPIDFRDSAELPIWSAYARDCLRRWRSAHPHDQRRPTAILLMTREIAFPEPGTDSCKFDEPETKTVVVFDPDGRLR